MRIIGSIRSCLFVVNQLINLSENWRNISESKDLEQFLRVVSGNNPDYAGFLIRLLLRAHEVRGKKIEAENTNCRVNSDIVRSIKLFVNNKLKVKGCKEKEEKQEMQVILTACTSNLHKDTSKNKVRESIGMSNRSFIAISKGKR